jgi:hypothetical protein
MLQCGSQRSHPSHAHAPPFTNSSPWQLQHRRMSCFRSRKARCFPQRRRQQSASGGLSRATRGVRGEWPEKIRVSCVCVCVCVCVCLFVHDRGCFATPKLSIMQCPVASCTLHAPTDYCWPLRAHPSKTCTCGLAFHSRGHGSAAAEKSLRRPCTATLCVASLRV